jgi:predicted amidophosphoribosyltransferase
MRKNLASLVFGGGCFLCRGEARDVLCAACDADLPRLRAPRCPRCALASPGGELCGRCLVEKPRYDATLAALAYEFPADTLVHALKFRGELALAPVLSALLLEKAPSG